MLIWSQLHFKHHHRNKIGSSLKIIPAFVVFFSLFVLTEGCAALCWLNAHFSKIYRCGWMRSSIMMADSFRQKGIGKHKQCTYYTKCCDGNKYSGFFFFFDWLINSDNRVEVQLEGLKPEQVRMWGMVVAAAEEQLVFTSSDITGNLLHGQPIVTEWDMEIYSFVMVNLVNWRPGRF